MNNNDIDYETQPWQGELDKQGGAYWYTYKLQFRDRDGVDKHDGRNIQLHLWRLRRWNDRGKWKATDKVGLHLTANSGSIIKNLAERADEGKDALVKVKYSDTLPLHYQAYAEDDFNQHLFVDGKPPRLVESYWFLHFEPTWNPPIRIQPASREWKLYQLPPKLRQHDYMLFEMTKELQNTWNEAVGNHDVYRDWTDSVLRFLNKAVGGRGSFDQELYNATHPVRGSKRRRSSGGTANRDDPKAIKKLLKRTKAKNNQIMYFYGGKRISTEKYKVINKYIKSLTKSKK